MAKHHLPPSRLEIEERKQECREIVASFKKVGCRICGEKAPCCLSAHHLDPLGKDFSIGSINVKKVGPEGVREELKKCVCLCENCHRKVHAGILQLEAA